jgi:hypothetical protein
VSGDSGRRLGEVAARPSKATVAANATARIMRRRSTALAAKLVARDHEPDPGKWPATDEEEEFYIEAYGYDSNGRRVVTDEEHR